MSDFDYMPMLSSLGADSQEGAGMPWEGAVTPGPVVDGVVTGSATIDAGGKGARRAQIDTAVHPLSRFGKLDWRTIAAVGGVIALGGLAYWVYRTKFAGKKGKRRGRRRRR